MLSSPLKEEYVKLQERERKFARYRRPSIWLINSALVVMLGGVVAIPTITLGSRLFLGINVVLDIFVIFGLIFAWYFTAAIIASLLGRKARIYNLGSDEWAQFHSCSILESIESYLQAKTSGLKEEHRKNALRSSKKLLSVIEKQWTIGNFKLAKSVFGDSISKLKDSIRNRLIANLETNNEQAIKELDNIIYNLAVRLANPTVEDLNHINKMMEKVESSRPAKLRFYDRCSSFFERNAIMKHVLVTATFVFAGYLVFFIGTNFVQISKEVAFGTAVGLFGILLAGYWQRRR